jgi:hypothetical protein
MTLDIMLKLHVEFVRLPVVRIPEKIRRNPKFFPYFKNCVGALDGSHIPAHVREAAAAPFRNQKGAISQNVLGACTFDLRFCYVLAGWEGSAHDGRVLQDAFSKNFHVPKGKYYLGDAGYGLSEQVLTPYRGVRYHLRETRLAGQRYNSFYFQ